MELLDSPEIDIIRTRTAPEAMRDSMEHFWDRFFDSDMLSELHNEGDVYDGVEDLALAQWKKLVWNVPFNGLTIAEGGVDTRTLLEMPGGEDDVRALMEEVRTAAGALGHDIKERFLDQQIEATRPMGCYRPSSMIDYIDGRDVEVEAIWAEPLRRARAAGAELPRWEQLLERIRKRLAER